MLTLTKIERITLFEDKPNVTLTSYIAGTSAEMPFNDKRKAILIRSRIIIWRTASTPSF